MVSSFFVDGGNHIHKTASCATEGNRFEEHEGCEDGMGGSMRDLEDDASLRGHPSAAYGMRHRGGKQFASEYAERHADQT